MFERFRNLNSFAAWLASAVLAVNALVPVGFMLHPGGTGLTYVLCADQGALPGYSGKVAHSNPQNILYEISHEVSHEIAHEIAHEVSRQSPGTGNPVHPDGSGQQSDADHADRCAFVLAHGATLVGAGATLSQQFIIRIAATGITESEPVKCLRANIYSVRAPPYYS